MKGLSQNVFCMAIKAKDEINPLSKTEQMTMMIPSIKKYFRVHPCLMSPHTLLIKRYLSLKSVIPVFRLA